jgi:Domain of unknown function (DUF4375)
MPDSLAAVLSAEVGFDLCNGLYSLLLAHHGEGFDPADIPVEHRTVLLVWQTQRVIGNNGFNGFFATDLLGDPDYRHMRAAYDAIGCEPVAAAIRRVFEAFPDKVVPSDPRARVQAFGKANHTAHGALNRDFNKVQGALVAALTKYIRERADAFAGVDQPGKARPPAAAPGLDPDGPDPAAEGASDLPRWARVAFFARCARQVFPLWEEAWPDAPHEFRGAIEQAIILAEMSATEAEPVGGLKAAGTQVAQIVEAAVSASTYVPAFPQRAALIAAAAGSVIDFISGADDSGSYGFVKAIVADADRDDLMEDIQEDYQRIEQHATEGNWTDKTPVPQEVFDPNFKPKKGWWKRW